MKIIQQTKVNDANVCKTAAYNKPMCKEHKGCEKNEQKNKGKSIKSKIKAEKP